MSCNCLYRALQLYTTLESVIASRVGDITHKIGRLLLELMARKTKAQRDHEWADAESRVWDLFRPKLEAVQNFAGAQILAAETPPPNAPGRRFYSNLAFFLSSFGVPGGSSYAEKALYLQLIKRLDAGGGLKPGARQKIEKDLRLAMETQGPS